MSEKKPRSKQKQRPDENGRIDTKIEVQSTSHTWRRATEAIEGICTSARGEQDVPTIRTDRTGKNYAQVTADAKP